MARLPELSREEMSPEGQQAYDAITASRGRIVGPFAALLYHPALAEKVAAVGEQLRFHSMLPGAERELAILTAGREVEALFEWAAHEPIARREGVPDLQLRVLRTPEAAREPVWTPVQAAVLAFTDASTRAVAVPDAVFAAVRAHLGDRQVVELAALVAGYAMVSRFLVALEVPPPDGEVAG